MQNRVLRVYCTNPADAESVSGAINYIDSGNKESFHGLSEFQVLLTSSVSKNQLGFTDLLPRESGAHDNVSVIG